MNSIRIAESPTNEVVTQAECRSLNRAMDAWLRRRGLYVETALSRYHTAKRERQEAKRRENQ